MKTIMICCRTIEQEVQAAMKYTGISCPCVWVESGLHNVPGQLAQRLQQELDALPGTVERVLLGFGFCGNAVKGLHTGNFTLIVPRVDDCITLLLGSCQRRNQLMREEGTYFLTEGWLKGERNLWVEFERVRERFGEGHARRIFAVMLAHYQRLAVVDTGLSDLDVLLPETKKFAGGLGLRHQVISGTLDYFRILLTGPWDEDQFLVVPPCSTVTLEDLHLPVFQN